MSTESAVKGMRGAMTWAQGGGDPTTYLADPKGLPFGPDKPRAIERLAQSLLAAHPAAPGYWADQAFSGPSFPVISETTAYFERWFGGKVNPDGYTASHRMLGGQPTCKWRELNAAVVGSMPDTAISLPQNRRVSVAFDGYGIRYIGGSGSLPEEYDDDTCWGRDIYYFVDPDGNITSMN